MGVWTFGVRKRSGGGRFSACAVGEGGPDGRAGLQRSEHRHGSDGGAGELGGHVGGDRSEAEHPDVDRRAGRERGFQVGAGVVPQAEVEALALDGPLGRLSVPLDDGFPYNGTRVWRVSIRRSAGFVPMFISGASEDNRYLGVRVKPELRQ